MALQKIGTSGYTYIIDRNGTLKYHPEPTLIDTNISEYHFVKQQITQDTGYIEYMWKNPNDDQARPKALYMTYF